jgi:microcystin-dependent protein
VTENAAFEAIHQAVAPALASLGGVVTLPETANAFNVSGTEAVTSIAGWSAGIVLIKWDSARILTHGASLVLKNSLSRNVVAGDFSLFEFTASNTVREIGFHGAGSGVETGTVIMHAGASVPAGFLECAGQSLNRTDYPGLFSVVGTVHGTASGSTFNLPDLRGRFVRGYDHGAGTDPDAASRTAGSAGGATGDNVGTKQEDEFKSHTHVVNEATGNRTSTGAVTMVPDAASTDETDARGGNETRPKNVALMFVIKY